MIRLWESSLTDIVRGVSIHDTINNDLKIPPLMSSPIATIDPDSPVEEV